MTAEAYETCTVTYSTFVSPRDSNREVELGRARFVTHARSLFSRRHIHHDQHQQQQQQYPSSGTRTFDGERS